MSDHPAKGIETPLNATYPCGMAIAEHVPHASFRAAFRASAWRMAGKPGRTDTADDTGTITKVEPKTKRPSLYKVLLLNDDYTPMDFVVFVLEHFFNKSTEEATRIMMHVHQKGVGVCGVYTFEVAETKVAQVMNFARQRQHPLQCTMEKD